VAARVRQSEGRTTTTTIVARQCVSATVHLHQKKYREWAARGDRHDCRASRRGSRLLPRRSGGSMHLAAPPQTSLLACKTDRAAGPCPCGNGARRSVPRALNCAATDPSRGWSNPRAFFRPDVSGPSLGVVARVRSKTPSLARPGSAADVFPNVREQPVRASGFRPSIQRTLRPADHRRPAPVPPLRQIFFPRTASTATTLLGRVQR